LSLERVEKDLVGQIKLSALEAKVFLHVTTKGKMDAAKIAQDLAISYEEALNAAKNLVGRGGFIDISPTEFEAMHPRFTAVNMYRKMCQKENIEFKKNLIVDNIGVALEDLYDQARTRTK
jgi:sugar-specific transcriptional regulator TrmB